MRERELSDTLTVQKEPESSAALLEAIAEAEGAFEPYWAYCRTVDKVYSLSLSTATLNTYDDTFALFWASMEILKPAIYAKPPKPIASPRFKDGGKVEKTAAEMVERCMDSTFDREGIDDVMIGVRDDLALTNRGVAWATYETDAEGGGQRVCFEDLDRTDFLHEPARKWREVGWVARRAWMTLTQMKERFKGIDEETLRGANFTDRKDLDDFGMHDSSAKAGVWEVWSKVDNKVYWVTEGVRVILDEDEPHLNLANFFPCPRPAYGTLQRRSLIPVPDYKRYAYHLDQINDLTSRIYTLLEKVKLKVFIPAGGDIGKAVETALNATDDSIVIPVPAAALGQSGGSANLFVTLPLHEIAQTIQGLIEARGQLIEDFYQLSGISDIMRGATEAQETLGAQQLKSQYGSVRVRDKIDELQRLARDLAAIAGEIMATKFTKDTFLELSRMNVPTRAEIKKNLKEAEDGAKEAMDKLRQRIEDEAEQSQEPVDPQAVQQQFQQGQQEIMAQFGPAIEEWTNAVSIEDVMDMLRDTHGRNLIIDIETDSTILTDEMAEKQSRAEFLNAFSTAAAGTQMLLQGGEQGRKLAGGILKFALQPYRANRELDDLVDDFVDNAEIPAGNEGEDADLAAANMRLAEAELMKAQAAGQKVQADAALKMQELQLRGAEAQSKAQEAEKKFQLEIEQTKGSIAETEARIEKIFAEIQKMGVDAQVATAKVGIEQHKEQREDVKTAADIQARQTDQAMTAQERQRQALQPREPAE